MQSAADEFAENGYERASLNRILERSGMGKSSFYYYFEDKADLFATLVEGSVADLFESAGRFDVASLSADAFWSACEDYYRAIIAAASADDRSVALGWMFYRLRAEGAESGPTERIVEAARAWVGGFILRGQALGVVRTDLPDGLLVDCMMGIVEAIDRWVVTNWSEIGEAARRRMASEHVDLVRRVLSP
ncbi:TetR/AcrR family transcriptional regulator [Acuticoccus mangrovi]|uniref:TetR/AcrR family transcriptional regulator n=1 Tax=Acuticoccus mangrovi TaxID=2796142 RepID=A0A934IGV9_9HYPH|nr:TetR/AcrR family transcriptional regulator [Acuticoccus mangrovi]MBJ3776223.1 TetR/AcrR family transcriptional regulator [Acuticoccus mangrovi]